MTRRCCDTTRGLWGRNLETAQSRWRVSAHLHGDRALGLREWDGCQEGAFPPTPWKQPHTWRHGEARQVADTQIGERMMSRSPFIIATKPTLLGNVCIAKEDITSLDKGFSEIRAGVYCYCEWDFFFGLPQDIYLVISPFS